MTNSAGGILTYGIAEFQDNALEYLPEKLDPVDRTVFSKEWLEHIVGNIQPRIDGVSRCPAPAGRYAGTIPAKTLLEQ